ncbi:pIIIa [Fowl aviadenovirus A]|nr:pIIIa [Fowl aviadenovirus A]WNM87359.1 pIIIa [Fowl aviadenovirus A]WNM87437.1 pIIIa [Fowl aviadenovirus A]WNM87476.1 pIIIa [Fowl aviadenovirus A]WNM87515.1 pIIIa [Fowl aviadenovirus A]
MTSSDTFLALAPYGRQEVADALSSLPDGKDARSLRHAPYANRLIKLQSAMVPPKVDGTSERVAEIVKGLAEQGAIYPDQMGAIHSDLLNRAYTWNSMGVQESIQALVNDVIHGQNRTLQDELARTKEIANASLLTQFFDSLYKTVDRGQRNFEGFKKLLRLFVNNVPNAEVYGSSGSFSLQINLGGSSQNINLTNAFENLKPIWGARWDAVNNPRIGALLTPNTRALLFFVSSFYDYGAMEPGSYLDNIMRLYKEAIRADVDAEGDAIMELGEAGANLNLRFNDYKDTLNYLLQNREVVPDTAPLELSAEQEMLLKYLMRQLRQALKDGVPADISISTMTQYLDPRLYQTNKVFVEKLQNYLLAAQARNPVYYRLLVLDPNWRPPAGLYTGNYVIPDRYDFEDVQSELEYAGPSRDEYFDDSLFAPGPQRRLNSAEEAQLERDIESLTGHIDEELGVQSQAGWLADHRLPAAFDGALSLTERNAYNTPLPPDSHMRSRSSSVASDLGLLNLSGTGGPGFFASLRPSIGSRQPTGTAVGLRPTTPYSGSGCMRGTGLARKVLNPAASRRGRKLRFY